MELSEYIKNYRATNSLSMQKLAEACGVTRGYICMLEKNRNSQTSKPIAPNLKTLRGIAKGTGKTLDELLSILDESISLNGDSISEPDTTSSYFAISAGEKLKKEIEKRGSLKEFADAIGEPISNVLSIIQGRDRAYNYKLLQKCCVYLDVPPSFFFDFFSLTSDIGSNFRVLRETNFVDVGTISNFLSLSAEQYLSIEDGVKPLISTIEDVSEFYNIPMPMIMGNDFEQMLEDPSFKVDIRMRFISREWYNEVGANDFTEQEIRMIMYYAKFLVSQRSK